MTQIFISYASEDRPRVEALVQVLEAQGYPVWWDRQLLTGGAYDRDIEAAVDASVCMIVVWSRHSVDSRWVRAEANEGLERGVLVPVVIDDVRPPLVFRQVQTIALHGWPAERPAAPLRALLDAIAERLGAAVAGGEVAAPERLAAGSLTHERSLAVLPFQNMSPDPADGYFADGLSEQILDVLSRVPDLRVAARTSSFQFRGQGGGDASAIGAQLNVSFLLEGSVRRAGKRVRISARLTRVVDGYTLWSRTYDRELDDVFAIQDDVSGRVASALKSAFREQAVRQQARDRTDRAEAYDAYLLALHYDREMHRGGPEEVELIREHCERAIRLDPDYLPAHLLLADTYLNRMGFRMSLAEARPLAQAVLEKAVALAPDDPALLLRVAELRRTGNDYAGALELYERVREMVPDDVHNDYASTLFTVGRLDEAIRLFNHNIERDPENFSLWFYLGAAHYGRRDTAAAIRAYERSLAIVDGGFLADGVRSTLAGTWVLAGDRRRAAEVLEPCLQPSSARIEIEIGLIACVQGMLGDQAPARAALAAFEAQAEAGHLDPQGPFWAALGAEDRDAAFRWLEAIVREDAFPSVYFLTSWPMLDVLRDDPRFAAVLRAGGLAASR